MLAADCKREGKLHLGRGGGGGVGKKSGGRATLVFIRGEVFLFQKYVGSERSGRGGLFSLREGVVGLESLREKSTRRFTSRGKAPRRKKKNARGTMFHEKNRHAAAGERRKRHLSQTKGGGKIALGKSCCGGRAKYSCEPERFLAKLLLGESRPAGGFLKVEEKTPPRKVPSSPATALGRRNSTKNIYSAPSCLVQSLVPRTKRMETKGGTKPSSLSSPLLEGGGSPKKTEPLASPSEKGLTFESARPEKERPVGGGKGNNGGRGHGQPFMEVPTGGVSSGRPSKNLSSRCFLREATRRAYKKSANLGEKGKPGGGKGSPLRPRAKKERPEWMLRKKALGGAGRRPKKKCS